MRLLSTKKIVARATLQKLWHLRHPLFWYCKEIGGLRAASTMQRRQDYSQWSTEELISRVTLLEQQLRDQTEK